MYKANVSGFCDNHHAAVLCVFVASSSILCAINLVLVSRRLGSGDLCGSSLSRASRPDRYPVAHKMDELQIYTQNCCVMIITEA